MTDIRRTLRTLVLLSLGLGTVACDDEGLGPEDPDPISESILRNEVLVQVDRFGLPGVNTAFTDAATMKDGYNRGTPATDEARFLASLSAVIQARFGLDPADADALADFVLPDVQPLGNLSGFPNGRRLEDDVIDTVLSLIFGVFGPDVPALQSDNVDANDRPFLTEFPYLADPHAP
ncbi:MAG: DUF4331 family protein [Gemmatimonadota bacterium]|nr:DUF4331 family protein [Gemmatimonadota bacterium]